MTENTIKLDTVNFMLDHAEMDFVGYEFWIQDEITIEESGCDQSLFRMDVNKADGSIEIYCAYSEDYDIMEDATEYFNVEEMKKQILEFIENNGGIANQGAEFVKYCALIDAGYSCEDAISECYE